VSEIITGSKSILSAMATGEILRLKSMKMEGLVPVDPDFIAVFSHECDYLT
jgi:ABC-type hemin transport system substrate-binding protein